MYVQVKSDTPVLLCSVTGYDASGRVDDLAAQQAKQCTSIAIGKCKCGGEGGYIRGWGVGRGGGHGITFVMFSPGSSEVVYQRSCTFHCMLDLQAGYNVIPFLLGVAEPPLYCVGGEGQGVEW